MNLIFQMSRSKLKSGSELLAKSSPMRQHIYFINFISSRSDLMEKKKNSSSILGRAFHVSNLSRVLMKLK